jgi:hypothetical protein
MGCGFSSGEITKAADDEERILNSSSTELQQDMGAGQSKQKSKQKNNKKKNGVNNGSGISGRHTADWLSLSFRPGLCLSREPLEVSECASSSC